MGDLDLVNRDPNNINSHLQCNFEDIIAEPDGTHSIDCCWKLTFSCFTCWKSCSYNLLVILCGCCISIHRGCMLGYVVFDHVWCVTPGLRMCAIGCNPMQKCWAIVIQCCLSPICDSCGLILSNIKVTKG